MNKYAFLVGVNKYQHLPELPYVTKDIRRMSEVLEVICGFTIFKNLLTDKEASENNILEHIENFFLGEYPQDTLLLFYFSGHGLLSKDRRKGYLGCYDTKRTERGSFLNALDMSILKQDYFEGKLYARQILIILDCCYSGAFLKKGQQDNNAFLNFLERERIGYVETGTLNVKGAYSLPRASGLMAASSELEGAFPTKDGEMSLYTKFLIEALEGENPDAHQNGVYSVATIDNYIQKQFKRLQEGQNPLVYGKDFPKIILVEKEVKSKPQKLIVQREVADFTTALSELSEWKGIHNDAQDLVNIDVLNQLYQL